MNKKIMIGLIALGAIFSCKDDDKVKPKPKPKPVDGKIEVPATYSFKRNNKSTVSFTGQTARIKMATAMIGSMNVTKAPVKQQLLDMYVNKNNRFGDDALDKSGKSVKSKVAASKDFFSANVAEKSEHQKLIETWLKAQIDQVFPKRGAKATRGVPGYIVDGSKKRYVNSKGYEYDQLVAKSLIGSLILDQIVNNYLSPAKLDDGNNKADNDAKKLKKDKNYTNMEHYWDEGFGYMYGGQGTDSEQVKSSTRYDAFLNKYTVSVDNKPQFKGIATEILNAFKAGRTAIVNKDYKERDKQANIIKAKLSKVVAIRTVYYLQAGKKALANRESAFHDLSEAYGFVYSLRFTRKPNSNDPYFTKKEVGSMIDRIDEGQGLWDVKAETLDAISKEIAKKFDFTVEQAAK